MLLVSRDDVAPGDFDIEFNYDQVQWETGGASGGSGGEGGASARVGFSNGGDHTYELPGSAFPGSFLDRNPAGLVHGSRSSDVPGRYVFHIRNGGNDAEARLYARNVLAAGNPASNQYVPCAGDPVNCATGDYWTKAVDVAVPGRGPVQGYERTYNSLAADQDGPYGYGWASTLGAHLRADASTATVVQENGSEVTFTRAGQGWSAPSWVLGSLTQAGDGTWTFTRRKKTIVAFDAGGSLTSVADLNGESTRVGYAAGHLSSVTDSSGAMTRVATNPDGRIASLTSPSGAATTFAYTPTGDLAAVTAPDGGTTRFGYAAGHLLTSVKDAVGSVSSTTYDSTGRAVTQQAPDGGTTTFAYTGTSPSTTTNITDPDGRVVHETFSDLALTTRTVGYGTPRAATTAYTTDPVTLGIATATDALGAVTGYTYDASGNTVKVTLASGGQYSSAYDGTDGLTTQTDPTGRVRTYTYDARGNLTTVRAAVGAAQTAVGHGDAQHPGDITDVIDPAGNTTQLAYTNTGQLSSLVQPTGGTLRFDYDTGRQVIAEHRPSGATMTLTRDVRELVTKIVDPIGGAQVLAYDAVGRLVGSTDPSGHTSTRTYDAAGRVTQQRRADGSLLVTAYDTAGRPVAQTDASGRRTTYGYDALGNLATTAVPGAGTSSSTFDDTGRLLSVTDGRGVTTNYGYDPDSHLTTVKAGSTLTTLEYDAAGRRVAMTDSTGRSTYSYDDQGRLARHIDGQGKAVPYAHDTAGNISDVTYPSGATLHTAHDADGRTTSVKDWTGGAFTFAYDADGHLTTQDAPDGSSTRYRYDAAGRPTATAVTIGQRPVLSLTETLDADGLRTAESSTGPAGAGKQQYGYDPLGQLTTWTNSAGSGNTTNYSYDHSGLLTGANSPGKASTLAYDSAGLLASLTTSPGSSGGTLQATYDANGNRTGTTGPDGTTALTWDASNRLASDSGPAGGASQTAEPTKSSAPAAATSKAVYSYDGVGLRTDKTVGSQSTHFVYDVTSKIPTLLEAGAVDFVYGPNGSVLEQVAADGTALYLHHDSRGSTRVVTDRRGGVVAAYDYTPFGLLTGRGNTAAPVTPLLFAGGWRDAESGLYWLHARYYDPGTAQFLSVDPLHALTWETFAYAANSPLSLIDPTGLFGFGSILQITSVIASTVSAGASFVAVGCAILLQPECAAPAELLALGAGAVATASDVGYGAYTGHYDTTGLALDAVGLAAGGIGFGLSGAAKAGRLAAPVADGLNRDRQLRGTARFRACGQDHQRAPVRRRGRRGRGRLAPC